ncbi:hypothetical protein SUGI_1162220 [Cryptomeria japonica]|nr:hypothetical protein SUGI_1162220 [Cryptomeria japonica]
MRRDGAAQNVKTNTKLCLLYRTIIFQGFIEVRTFREFLEIMILLYMLRQELKNTSGLSMQQNWIRYLQNHSWQQ